MSCFIKKNHESKKGHPPSYFYNKHCQHKANFLCNLKMFIFSKQGRQIFMKITNKDTR